MRTANNQIARMEPPALALVGSAPEKPGGSLRRSALRRLCGGASPLEESHRLHRNLIQSHERNRHRDLRDGIGRGEDGRDDEHPDNGELAPALQLLVTYDADLAEERQYDRKLEAQPEC